MSTSRWPSLLAAAIIIAGVASAQEPGTLARREIGYEPTALSERTAAEISGFVKTVLTEEFERPCVTEEEKPSEPFDVSDVKDASFMVFGGLFTSYRVALSTTIGKLEVRINVPLDGHPEAGTPKIAGIHPQSALPKCLQEKIEGNAMRAAARTEAGTEEEASIVTRERHARMPILPTDEEAARQTKVQKATLWGPTTVRPKRNLTHAEWLRGEDDPRRLRPSASLYSFPPEEKACTRAWPPCHMHTPSLHPAHSR